MDVLIMKAGAMLFVAIVILIIKAIVNSNRTIETEEQLIERNIKACRAYLLKHDAHGWKIGND